MRSRRYLALRRTLTHPLYPPQRDLLFPAPLPLVRAETAVALLKGEDKHRCALNVRWPGCPRQAVAAAASNLAPTASRVATDSEERPSANEGSTRRRLPRRGSTGDFNALATGGVDKGGTRSSTPLEVPLEGNVDPAGHSALHLASEERPTGTGTDMSRILRTAPDDEHGEDPSSESGSENGEGTQGVTHRSPVPGERSPSRRWKPRASREFEAGETKGADPRTEEERRAAVLSDLQRRADREAAQQAAALAAARAAQVPISPTPPVGGSTHRGRSNQRPVTGAIFRVSESSYRRDKRVEERERDRGRARGPTLSRCPPTHPHRPPPNSLTPTSPPPPTHSTPQSLCSLRRP